MDKLLELLRTLENPADPIDQAEREAVLNDFLEEAGLARLRIERGPRRRILWKLGFDHRQEPGKEQFGQHGADMIWLLEGRRGVVHWRTFTGWAYPSNQAHYADVFDAISGPMAADLSVHAPEAFPGGHYPEQEQPCPWIGGRRCFVEYHNFQAQAEVLRTLLIAGGDAAWDSLERLYLQAFGEAP